MIIKTSFGDFWCCCGLYSSEIIPTADANEAFKDADVAILVGAMPRKEGMERKDLLKANVRIFKTQGEAIDKHAKKNVKVGCLLFEIICIPSDDLNLK